RAVARPRRGRPLSGDRHRGLDQPGDAAGGGARASAGGTVLPPRVFRLPPAARPDRGGRLPEGLRSAGGSGHRAVAAVARLPAAGSRRTDDARSRRGAARQARRTGDRMNSRSKRLQPAVDQAHQQTEDALAKLATQQQQLAKAEHQLGELERYRNEYAAAGEGGVSVSALLNRQQFVARID